MKSKRKSKRVNERKEKKIEITKKRKGKTLKSILQNKLNR